MTVRFGIVGAGLVAAWHAEAIRALPGAEVVAVMDRGSGKGRRIAPEADPRGADDLDAFLARDDIDVVTVASPSGAHAEAVIAAARAGKHCIVEKPMDVTLDRIDAMIEAHAHAGTTLGGIFNTRYSDGVRLLKTASERERFGRLTFASAFGPWWRDQSYYDEGSWKGTLALDGGGALMNQGIHSIDLLQWLVGSRVESVSGHTALLAHDDIEVEDTGCACLRFENGALGTLACTTSMWPGHFRTITLAGTDGTAVLADSGLLVWRFRDETEADERIRRDRLALPGAGLGAADPSAGMNADGHRAAFAEFLDALRCGLTPPVDGTEARKAVEIVLAVYDSARRGGVPVAPGAARSPCAPAVRTRGG